ncbi:hypothetical protein [Paenibacillus mucilaginosus]|uniref:Uncharacterized protein n=3 Tax=Paenibacillus mucilaginosus TaxID=61624 RepID=H6NHH8_9BACL|nr:hypothetical protein [Paenibacillus mucilaginosus]AEI40997.1 hypothetical protein KNP414_02436 [Paenibacillus mucilaginosus KNP414]AFC29575.1 hypothetical protein PM3016_2695 [Paenibacillus mucilaginosus 3016]AFH61749.1 hypothetical protein B2K_13645 [Paenibacillus mucilaginosus K02]MCG7211558.1 hypothetical protein [Paenibacillus mucilaginosus]WDM30072.1 hypothetical protein KCX80_13400 [Paenibacillus mucilaginosus]
MNRENEGQREYESEDGADLGAIQRRLEEAESITRVPGESAIDAADAMDAEPRD